MNDLTNSDYERGKAFLGVSDTPGSTSSGSVSAAPLPVDAEYERGKKLLDVTDTPMPVVASTAPTAKASPDTSWYSPETMFAQQPAARAFIAQDPNSDYSTFLPVKKDLSTGEYNLAFPSAVHQFATGVLDLVEGPASSYYQNNSRISPEATAALSVLSPRSFAYGQNGPLTANALTAARQQWSNYFPIENSAPTGSGAFASALHSHFANQAAALIGGSIGSGAGAMIGGYPGALIGGGLGTGASLVTKEMLARYGPRMTNAILQGLKNSPAITYRQMQVNPLYSLPAAGPNALSNPDPTGAARDMGWVPDRTAAPLPLTLGGRPLA